MSIDYAWNWTIVHSLGNSFPEALGWFIGHLWSRVILGTLTFLRTFLVGLPRIPALIWTLLASAWNVHSPCPLQLVISMFGVLFGSVGWLSSAEIHTILEMDKVCFCCVLRPSYQRPDLF